MTRLTTMPITAECFPTPALLLRTNDPAAQHDVREFAQTQAEAACALFHTLTEALHQAHDVDARVTAFMAAFDAAEDWRYRIAVASRQSTGRYGAGHAERFRTPVTDDNPNLFRLGEHQRFRDGAVWNPGTRTYTGGVETPASRTMRLFDALATARLTQSPSLNVVSNRVLLPGGRVAHGMRLLSGDAARRAATEMVGRIAARGGDTSRIITDGDLIYIVSSPENDRRTIFRSAMVLLAQDYVSTATALAAWLQSAYLLYQAPRKKRGSDATTRTFLVAAGTCLLGHPPVLLHDIDLRAYVRPATQFVSELRAAQEEVPSGSPLS